MRGNVVKGARLKTQLLQLENEYTGGSDDFAMGGVAGAFELQDFWAAGGGRGPSSSPSCGASIFASFLL